MITPISCCILKAENDMHYTGYVEAGCSRFDFELKLAGPISLLAAREPSAFIGTNRLIFQLEMKNGGSKIELTEKEFCFFLPIILVSVVEHGVTLLRHYATKLLHESFGYLPGWTPNPPPYPQISRIEITPETREMLNAEKFDCRLA